MATQAVLERTTFRTSRLLDFCSEKELVAQTGHEPCEWPLVILKELIDNALDACEEAGTAPQITVKVDSKGITVADNGPGLPVKTIEGILDYSVRVSSREAYVAPDRGAQGNALKCLVPMPFVLSKEDQAGRVDITTGGQRHEITFSVDPIRQEPKIERTVRSVENVQNGTSITVFLASCIASSKVEFVQLASDFTFLNPHLTLTVDWFGRTSTVKATAPDWQKWRPHLPTCAHWYGIEHFERLLAAYIAHDQDRGADRPVRDVIKEFQGLARSAKQKAVLDSTGLTRANLSSLVNGDGLDHEAVSGLLAAMQANTKQVKPSALGIIGKDHLRQRFVEAGCEEQTFRYKRIMAVDEGVPVVIEAAFALLGDETQPRRPITGINWSGAIGHPFGSLGTGFADGLSVLLENQMAGRKEPVVFLLHSACARVHFTDHGKTNVAIGQEEPMQGELLVKAVEKVTADWRKQRKREERGPEAKARRRKAMRCGEHQYSTRVTRKEAAWACMEAAYMQASGGGKSPAHARQIMYAARPTILEEAHDRYGDPLDLKDDHFTQTLLPDYMREHADECAGWDVVFDARGHFTEPHSGQTVPLGTLHVRGYLQDVAAGTGSDVSYVVDDAYPTCGPANRFGAVLFIEKEGFLPLFDAVKLAERYDVAIMSTKGMSVTAARTLVENVCGRHDIPLFLLRDFDKAGFAIAASFQKDTRRYQFSQSFEVVDLGLRLDDVETWGLDSEPVHYTADPRGNLEENGATPEEIAFLCEGGQGKHFYGRRVELNAFTSPDFIEWIEGKLQEHGVGKIVPDEDTLKDAYARAVKVAVVNKAIAAALDGAEDAAEKHPMPETLGAAIQTELEATPEATWDKVVAERAAENLAGDPRQP